MERIPRDTPHEVLANLVPWFDMAEIPQNHKLLSGDVSPPIAMVSNANNDSINILIVMIYYTLAV